MATRKKPPPTEPEDGEPHKLGYARVSTQDQNPQLQRDALVAAGVDPRDIFEEKLSGAKSDRPELRYMLMDTRPGDIVYVWKLDRLGRTAEMLYDTARRIQEKGARLVVLTMPGMDTGTPMGKAMFGMLAVFAEFERAMIRERTIAGLRSARAQGRVGGRRQKATDEKVLAAEFLPTHVAMKKLGYTSKAGWLKRLAKAKESKNA